MERVVHARCVDCGGSVFDLLGDDEQGYAERQCASCKARFVMLDSAEVRHEADPDVARAGVDRAVQCEVGDTPITRVVADRLVAAG